ncbi:DUF7017 domain-containing protein [Pontibacter locisalis]|uniref:DUF7017 domain-containing protein n=1 Tax=Pontibacter locisalis TaxID=1719035 RepID=A0ABW5IL96_9BACT
MSFNEVKSLRQSGKLEEAYSLAKQDLEAKPHDVWNKRSMAWVLYDLLKQNASAESYDTFISYLKELKDLELPEDEKMVFDNTAWQVGKMIYQLLKENDQITIAGESYQLAHQRQIDINKIKPVFEIVQSFHFTKPSEGYSFLFKAFHKSFKDRFDYVELVDWWNLDSFGKDDFQQETLPNGKNVMALAEQAYIAYAKKLLEGYKADPFTSGYSGDKPKLGAFLVKLDEVIDSYPELQYPPYYKAQILLAVGDSENVLSAFLPFAKKKRNDFWVWDLLADIFQDDEEKRIACLCRAMLCRTQEDFLSKIREKLAAYFISKGFYNEARTEIKIIVDTRVSNGWKVSNKVQQWQSAQWYTSAEPFRNNMKFYRGHSAVADNILFADTPAELAVIEFVNSDKKIANFIINQKKHGFFKYDRFFKSLEIGDVVEVRLSNDGDGNRYKLLTAGKTNQQPNDAILRLFKGNLRKKEGQEFAFVDDIFIEPKLVKELNMSSDSQIFGKALLSYNKKKDSWGWKAISVN